MTNALHTLEQHLAHAAPYLILAPPRSSSTALARTLLQHSGVGPYIHEPCTPYTHQGAPVTSILDRLLAGGLTKGALVKAMTHQLGTDELCRCFLRAVRQPIILLTRDPRLTIASRLRMILYDLARQPDTPAPQRARITRALESEDYSALDDIVTEAVFPLAYTGWSALERQLAYCRREGIDYVLVNARLYRDHPRPSLERLCARLNLAFEEEMLTWNVQETVRLGGLSGFSVQHAWYSRLVESTGVLPEIEATMAPEQFPRRFRAHLLYALRFYETTFEDPNLLMGAIRRNPEI